MQRDEHEEQIELPPEDDNAPLELLVAVTEMVMHMYRGVFKPDMRDEVEKKLEFIKKHYVS